MDTGFHHDHSLGSAFNRHAVSFQSRVINSTSGMIPMGNYYGIHSTAGMVLPGNPSFLNNNSGISQLANSGGSIILEPVPGLKHDMGLAVEWSAEEQYKLEEGLLKYGDEPSIMRYIKIAATLHEKTVRDVALRCRWMTRKRRKQEEPNSAKKAKDKKDKLAELLSRPSTSSTSPLKVAGSSPILNHRGLNDGISYEVLSGTIRQLLEQNNQVFGQISANMSAVKLKDNVNLFGHARNNINTMLNVMRSLPGPPLPVSMNEELANTVLPSLSRRMMLSSPSGMPMKQEPGC